MGKRESRYVNEQEIADIARAVVQENGGQVAVAQELELSQPTISKAVRGVDGYETVRRRILVEIGKYQIEEERITRIIEPKHNARQTRKGSRA